MKIPITVILLLFQISAFAQNRVVVNGKVETDQHNPVAMALVTITAANSTSIVSFKYTGQDGLYQLTFTRDTGTYRLSVKALGYMPVTFSIEKDAGNTMEKNFILKPNTVELSEVIIKSKATGVTVHEDTTTYKAKAFTNGTEKSVEDLLKKLPGVSVDDNGGISFKGKKVDKVFLDGDDLLGKNYKLATKNINASFIDEVQAMENFSEDDLLKGIEKSDKTVLNLKIDKKKQQLLFGSIDANLGNKGYNDLGINLFSYQRKAKIYLIGEHNNIGRRSAANDNQLNNIEINGNDDPTISSSPLIAADNLFYSQFKEDRINFNNESLGAIIATVRPADKLKIETNLSLYYDNNKSSLLNQTTYQLTNSTFFFNEHDQLQRKPLNGNIKLKVDYAFTTGSRLTYVFEDKPSRNNNSGQIFFQSDSTSENLSQQLSGRRHFIHHQLNYTNRLNDKNAFTVNANIFKTEDPQLLTISTDGDRFASLFNTPSVIQRVQQNAFNKVNEINLTAKLLGAKYKFNYAFSAGVILLKERLTSLAVLNSNTDTITTPPLFQNDNSLQTHTFFVKAGTAYTLKNIRLNLNINLAHTGISYADAIYDDKKDYNYVSPSFSIQYKLSELSKLNASYSLNNQFSSITDLNANYILEDYRTISKGLPVLNNQNSQTIKIGYNYDNFYDQFNLSGNVFFIQKNNAYSNDYFISEAYNALVKIITPKSNIYLGVLQADKYIPGLLANIRVNVNFSVNRYLSELNGGDLRQNTFTSGIYKITYTTAYDGFLNFALGGTLNSNNLKITAGNNNTHSNNNYFTGFANINLKKKKWLISVNNDISFINNSAYYFLDALVSYNLVKDRFTLSLSCKNLSNNSTFQQVFLNDYQVNKVAYNLLPGYVLLGANYKF